MNPTIRLDPKDNVVVATRFIARGEKVLKYNTMIGYASEDLPPGSWMHSHNIAFGATDRDYRFSHDYRPADILPPSEFAHRLGPEKQK